MVYLGPSRGCATCKRRRKKCDEARPSCLRCLTSSRTCGGYNDDSSLIFRSQESQGGNLISLQSTPRKCSLPVRIPCPETGILPEDKHPKEFSQEEVDKWIIEAFLYDYCVTSTNRELSRGYLDGLEAMLSQAGHDSTLAMACRAVANANHGRKLDRPRLTAKAAVAYQDLLGSLAIAMQNPEFAETPEALMIAMLLGLYEMIVAGESHAGNHNTHARGVAAILKTEHSPLDLFGAAHFAGSNNLSRVISQPATPHPIFTLLQAFNPLYHKACLSISDPSRPSVLLNELKAEATSLYHQFEHWQATQPEILTPRPLGHIAASPNGSTPAAGKWPGRVDTYFDYYIAGVWNTSRAARLLLLDLIVALSDALDEGENHTYERTKAARLLEDMMSSIPYHLTDDLTSFISGGPEGELKPGRAVGALLLMHPVFVASRVSTVGGEMREYLQECLVWIAANMGIGQAARLAKAADIDNQYFADGCMIVWTGMLI
ncbi:hypothetical protein V495_03599 [Pseudogymnoascus sp. VKM F-4514 (FW-929)]|nr:hypothetical protein V495_03599 [Pseudogymnoascus sp. VKM F-4514 (FW-929)]KFY66469.1 hypothetical protein V497_00925 [Pseudogymnoascus sp. VKM F-4516 (FW-969)]